MNEETLQLISKLMNDHNEFINRSAQNQNDLDTMLLFLRFAQGKLLEIEKIIEGSKMATYEYKCSNSECSEYEVLKDVSIPMSEYSEDKLPKCEACGESTQRTYSAIGHQTFGDGYKG